MTVTEVPETFTDAFVDEQVLPPPAETKEISCIPAAQNSTVRGQTDKLVVTKEGGCRRIGLLRDSNV